MENIKLSFIVPVYNVEQYLRKCVESLISQDYSDYEIILVDDGSTDNSGAICDDYASQSPTSNLQSPIIHALHQPNAGLSAARNAGLAVARGEYICFVDSDDYWQPNVLSGLMEQIERDNLEVLRFDFQNVNDNGVIIHPNKAPKRDVDYSEIVTDGETFLNKRLGPLCYAVMFIIRREIVPNFTEGIYFEDVDWTPRMILRTKRVASTPMMVYNYLWRVGSITLAVSPEKKRKILNDKMKLLYGFREQSRLVKDPKWFTWMTGFNTMTILNILATLPSSERKEYFREMRSLNVFPLSTKKEKILSHKLKIMIANISPSLYCRIMSLRS